MLVVSEFVTLDGVMEDPGGAEGFERGGWAFRYPRGEADTYKLDELMKADALLLGRFTYEGFAEAWPEREGTGEFGEKMNSMPKFVVSSTLEHAGWKNTTVLSGELGDEVAGLVSRFEGDILVSGSAQLVRELLALGLVDELRLMVFPVILGAGKRLFADGPSELGLVLVDARRMASVTLLTLRPSP
jgi:dihydrofolate reductase